MATSPLRGSFFLFQRRLFSRGQCKAAAATAQCEPVIPPNENGRKNGDPITFDDCRLAYRSKATWEIVRSLFVLKYCRHEFLVDHSEKFVKIGKSLLRAGLFSRLMKLTFFGQFVAGENQEEIRALITRLKEFNVSVILSYAVEDDEAGGDQEKSGLIKHDHEPAQRKDPRDQNMASFLKTIDTVAETTRGDGFTAIKVTALSRPETLMTLTDIIRRSTQLANELVQEPGMRRPITGRDIPIATIQNALKRRNVDDASAGRWFEVLETRGDRVVDTVRWSGVFDGTANLDDISYLPGRKSGVTSSTPEERVEVTNLVRRMETIAKHAYEANMRVLVDAEQSYFQPAIARLSLELMRRYNRERPTIYNTYQCYLKETFDNVSADVALARQENFVFGAKIVRGAYIVLERQRAAEMRYTDPINPTFEATTAMYTKVVDHLLEDIKSPNRTNMTHVVIAGHNEATVKWAVNELEKKRISRKTRQVYFGQLLGMCDQLSFTLADRGFNVVKCVPYGSVEEVLPYLIRRAHENRGFMEKTDKERMLLRRELFYRIKERFTMQSQATLQNNQ